MKGILVGPSQETIIDPEAEASGDVTADTYGNDDEAVDAVDNGVAWEDRIQFLHNQTTANFECLDEGQGCDTVFVTPTARTIDISHAWVMKNAIVLVVSPMTCGSIIEMLKKYIFFADKVEIQDITKQTSMFALLGPKSSKIMEDLNLGDLVGQPYGSHKHYSVGKLTSFTAGTKSSGPFGLGYIKRRAASESDSVTVGDSIIGTLVEVPFLREQLPPPKP
ncbi:UNVERIFIED_CONTAM: putative transferase, chloroplastic [Sesamum calycinum]|uniref:Transferase, chloroplastic n=1 Tax=Sesamum calycinum TaxID=2727403 RepID=A0AAW2PQ10_9LAMI